MPVSSDLVVFRGGFSANWTVVARLLELEGRGARFVLEDGGRFRVIPPALLTAADIAFLRSNRAECRSVLSYDADQNGRPQ